MLKQNVIDAVAAGLFHIYCVRHVDQALELLMGQTAGILNDEGDYPENTINFKVVARLKEISDMTSDDDDEEDGNE